MFAVLPIPFTCSIGQLCSDSKKQLPQKTFSALLEANAMLSQWVANASVQAILDPSEAAATGQITDLAISDTCILERLAGFHTGAPGLEQE